MTRAVLVTPTQPAASGNGLAMRGDLLRQGLARVGAVDVVVAPSAAAQIGLEARAGDAGLVLVHRAYLAPLLDGLLEAGERPAVILDVDDLDPAGGLEAEYVRQVDVALACCSADAQVLSDLGAPRAEVVPNAINLPAQVQSAPAAGDGTDLLFVGNLSYAPNVEAAGWLVNEVLPMLAGVTVTIAGSEPGADVQSLAGGGVTVIADPLDLAPLYTAARLAVVPVLRGGGSRIKLLEAYAHARAVVATSAGVRGTELGGGVGPAVIADDPGEFAACCRHLLDAPERAAALGRRGRGLVAGYGTVEVVAATIARIVQPLVGSAAPTMDRALNHRDLELVEAEDGYVIYDTARDRVHYLNHTAALVFELLNGTNSESRIAELLQRAYELPDPPERETHECIDRLVGEGLVE